MRFVIYGAGGVGGVVGAQLFKADQDVVMIARGEHLQAMQAHGLRYETPFADERLTIPVVGHPGEVDLRPDDVFLMTMKSQHTSEAFEELRWVHGDGVCVVCCQNGVANERMALRRFASVYAMLVYVPAQLIEPGRIQCHARLKSGVLDLGRFPGGSDDRAGAIAQGLEAANFSVRADPSVMRFKYAKLLMNLNNALEAIAPKGDLAKEISAAMKAEGLACFEAAGIEFAGDAEVRGRRKGIFEFGEIPGVERIGGSSRQSLLRATGDIEADYLNGEIVLLGRMHGVPTPANEVVRRVAVEMAGRREAPGTFSLEALQLLIEEASA